jgi:hypothetical protein
MIFQAMCLILFGIVCFAAGTYQHEDECPRMIKGYDCVAGNYTWYPNGCDHSERAVLQAKLDMLEDDDESND